MGAVDFIGKPGGRVSPRLEEIERDLIAHLPKSTVFTHLESLEDPVSWDDLELDRAANVH